MEFLSLELVNLFSYAHALLPLEKGGVVLVSGGNGSGKSSLTSKALCWALFGQTVGGVLGESAVNCLAPSTHAFAEVAVRIRGTTYLIRRSRNPTLLTVNGESHRRSTDTQEFVTQLLGMDLEVFLNSSYFGQEREMGNFLRSSPRTQLHVLEGVLMVSRLDKIVEVTKEMGIHTKNEVASAELHRRHAEFSVSEKSSQILVCQRRLVELDVDVRVQEDRLLALEKERPLGSIDGIDRARIEMEHAETKARLETNRREWSEVTGRVAVARMQISGLEERVRPLRSGKCPTCGAVLSTQVSEELQREQDELRTRVAAAKKNLDLDLALTQVRAGAELHLVRNLSTLTEALRNIDAHAAELAHGLGDIEKQRKEVRDELNRIQGGIMETDTQINQHATQLKIAQEALERWKLIFDAESARLSHLAYWQDVFSRAFRNFIVEQALPFLQERTAHHLALLGNPELKVAFSTNKTLKSGEERSLFNVLATREQGGQSFDSLSGGERQMASFAVGLAISELCDSQSGSASNLMILDEPFTELDARNCEAVVQYAVTELVKRKATILLISNDERMKTLIQKGIQVEKEDGRSFVHTFGG